MSGAIIDPDRLVIGTEEGLFCLDLDRNGKSMRLSKMTLGTHGKNIEIIICFNGK